MSRSRNVPPNHLARFSSFSGYDGEPPPQVGGRMRAGLQLLMQAAIYADQFQRDVWDFAVEICSLRAADLTDNDIRWLVCKGYVEHAREISLLGRNGRQYQAEGDLQFSRRSCFVLTLAGAEFARTLSDGIDSSDMPPRRPLRDDDNLDGMPQWDIGRRVLRVGAQIAKQFRVPAPNQERILSAFQEEHWPDHIDDPLPPGPDLDPKLRLHKAIYALNRNQRVRLIQFHGDGQGTGVCWELVLLDNGRPSRPLQRKP